MRLLLDTCTFLWLTTSPDRVPAQVVDAFGQHRNDIFLSAASAWEVAIKHKLGRLNLPGLPSDFIPECLDMYGLQTLEITMRHVTKAGGLSLHHNDPFDRLLIAQAEIEGLTIATPDSAFAPYGVSLIW